MSAKTDSYPQQQPEPRREAHGTSIDEKDLLIRSTTTLLRLIGHKIADDKDRPEDAKQGHFLDRVARSFVSGTRPADVAAVIYWDNRNHRLCVDAVQESHGYDLLRNRPLTTTSQPEPVTNANLMQMLEGDMVNFFYSWGIGAISVGMHAQKLQSLLNAIHKDEGSNSTTAKDDLRRYVYAYCAHKIWDRLKTHPPGYAHGMLRFFLDANYSGANFRPETLAREIPVAFKLHDNSEVWLSEALQTMECLVPCHEVSLGQNRTTEHLALDQNNIWNLYTFVGTVLLGLRLLLMEIRPFVLGRAGTEELTQQNRDKFVQALDRLHSYSSILYKLMHNSPSFWRLIKLLETVVPSPTHGHSAWTSQQLNLPDVDISPPESQKTSLDQDSGPIEELQDEETDTAEDEIGLTENRAFGEFCDRWFDSITQWFHAVEDLCGRSDIRAIVRQGLVIRARDATLPANRHSQMALMNTLAQIPGYPADQAYFAVKELAKRRPETLRFTQPTKYEGTSPAGHLSAGRVDTRWALKILSEYPGTSLEDWEEAFSGPVHCEADLACQMESQHKEIKDKLIGVSKRCCFCCNVLLKHLGLDSNSLPTHGKVYYWTPPPTATTEAKQAVLDELLAELKRVIDDFYNRREDKRPSTGDSGKGSDSGSVQASAKIDELLLAIRLGSEEGLVVREQVVRSCRTSYSCHLLQSMSSGI